MNERALGEAEEEDPRCFTMSPISTTVFSESIKGTATIHGMVKPATKNLSHDSIRTPLHFNFSHLLHAGIKIITTGFTAGAMNGGSS